MQLQYVLDLHICYTMSVTVMIVIIVIISIFVAQLHLAFLFELVTVIRGQHR